MGGQAEIFNREAGTSWKESQHRSEKIKTLADTDSERLQGPRKERELGERQGSGDSSRHDDEFENYEFGPYEPAIRRWTEVIGRNPPEPTDDRGITPEFVEWLMGLPAGHVTNADLGLSTPAQLKILGNGVVPQQALLALQMLN